MNRYVFPTTQRIERFCKACGGDDSVISTSCLNNGRLHFTRDDGSLLFNGGYNKQVDEFVGWISEPMTIRYVGPAARLLEIPNE